MKTLVDTVQNEIEKIVDTRTKMTLGEAKLVMILKQIDIDVIEIRFVSLKPFWYSCFQVARDIKKTAENVEGVKKAIVYCHGHTFRHVINDTVNLIS